MSGRLVTTIEVAERVGGGEDGIRELVNAGRLRSIRRGGRNYFVPSHLEEDLAAMSTRHNVIPMQSTGVTAAPRRRETRRVPSTAIL